MEENLSVKNPQISTCNSKLLKISLWKRACTLLTQCGSVYPFACPLSSTTASTSLVSRNCSMNPSACIHFVIRTISSGLSIMASYVLFLAFLTTSPLPCAHWGHTMTMCLAFCDGYPHWHLGSSTPGTFLRYRYALSPTCSLRIWVAILLWALVRFWRMAYGVPV